MKKSFKLLLLILIAVIVTSQTYDVFIRNWQEIPALFSLPFTAYEAGVLTSKAIILASFCAGCIYALQKFKVLKRLAAVKF